MQSSITSHLASPPLSQLYTGIFNATFKWRKLLFLSYHVKRLKFSRSNNINLQVFLFILIFSPHLNNVLNYFRKTNSVLLLGLSDDNFFLINHWISIVKKDLSHFLLACLKIYYFAFHISFWVHVNNENNSYLCHLIGNQMPAGVHLLVNLFAQC